MSMDARLRRAAEDTSQKITGLSLPPTRRDRRWAALGWAFAAVVFVSVASFLGMRLATDAAGGEHCLVGTWVLDNESFLEAYSGTLTETGMGDARISDLGGTYTVNVHPDGTFDANRDNWGYSVANRGTLFTVVANGDEIGTWSADGSTVNMTTDVSNVTLDLSREVDGEKVPIPGSQEAFDALSMAVTSDYSCSQDVVTISADGASWAMHRG